MKAAPKDTVVPKKLTGYYSLLEQCVLCGNCDPATLRRWIKSGLYPQQTKLGPRRVGCRVEIVNNYLDDPELWRFQNVKA